MVRTESFHNLNLEVQKYPEFHILGDKSVILCLLVKTIDADMYMCVGVNPEPDNAHAQKCDREVYLTHGHSLLFRPSQLPLDQPSPLPSSCPGNS